MRPNRSFPLVSTLVSLAGLMATPALADGTFNLTGKILGTPVVTPVEGGGAKIKFDVQVDNDGPDAAAGTLRLKPILVPEKTTATWPEHGGRVLDSVDTTVDIASKKSATITYEMSLPTLTRAKYYVAAIINSNRALAETSLIDNVTDLVPLNELEVTAAPAPASLPSNASVLDFISSNGAAMELGAGVIKHDLNTYSLSVTKAEPDFGAGRVSKGLSNNSGELFARFMFADVKSRKVYTVIYQDDYGRDGFNAATPEKFWFLVTWHNIEKLLDGKYRQHDTYSETTHFDGVPPGDYKYLVLINSHDFPETDIHNNLSVYDVRIQGARAKATVTETTEGNGNISSDVAVPELWIVGAPGKPTDPSAFGLTTDYSSAHLSGVLRPRADASWAKIDGLAADLSGDGVAPLKASSPGMADEGIFSGTLDYEVSSIPSGALYGVTGAIAGELPIKYFVRKPETAPAIEFAPASLEVEDTYERLVASGKQKVTIKNPGNADLHWKALATPSWLSVEPKEGVVKAGESVDATVQIDPNALNRGDSYSAEIQLMTNIATGAGGIRKVSVDLSLSQ